MKNIGIIASAIGLVANFALFLTKIYVGISSNSLSIYCDAINNLGDTLACAIAVGGFLLAKRMSDLHSTRAQSLCTFVISIIIAVTGGYFVYNGVQRLFYPLPVSYSKKYAVVIIATIFVKVLMGVMFIAFNRRAHSTVLRAMVLDSFLDCFVTLFALMGLVLVARVNFAVDAVFAIITGTMITVSALRTIVAESKYLITN